MTIPKRLEPLVPILLQDVAGTRGVIIVSKNQTKKPENLCELLKNLWRGMLGFMSRYCKGNVWIA